MVYIDDVLVGTPEPCGNIQVDRAELPESNRVKSTLHIIELHFLHVCDVLTAFQTHMTFVKGVKMHLFMNVTKFRGHIPSKFKAIRKWNPQCMTRVTHLNQFLGLAKDYDIYMKEFARVAAPLTRQLKSPTNEEIIPILD